MSTVRIKKATAAEREAYALSAPIYPLYGWAVLPDGQRAAIEDLRGSWSAPDPVYEVLAPDGMHWGGGEWTRSLLCHNLKDVAKRASVGLDEGDPQ